MEHQMPVLEQVNIVTGNFARSLDFYSRLGVKFPSLGDEPTGDLDRKSADEVMALIDELVGKYNKTILMVTHDPVVAARAHTTLHLEKGVLIEGSRQAQPVMAGGAA